MLVHVSGSHVSIDVTLVKYIHQVFGSFDNKSRKIFDVDTSVFVFQVKFFRPVLGQQISNFFLIDFQVRRSYQVFSLAVALNLLENRFECSGHDSSQSWVLNHSCNCESLSCTRLTIGKDRSIVALDDIINDGVRCFHEDGLLL